MMLLHGEQYLSIKGPIPVSGTLVSETRIMEALDKGKAAAITTISTTSDKATGEVVFENQSTVFIRGAGGFGGKKTGIGEFLVPLRVSSATDGRDDRPRSRHCSQQASCTSAGLRRRGEDSSDPSRSLPTFWRLQPSSRSSMPSPPL